ncbi:lysophospholipase L1-like esterase [Lachnospiraceae bacterium JC7]|nr:lysophospholipase L1-like esterase [Lachnospiraceae bacterium JC7]
MKTLVFFGDSNTYGYDPSTGRGSGGRYPVDVRWTELVKKELKNSVEIFSEGRVRRCIPSMKFEYKEFMDIIEGYDHIDYFVIMLGTNDFLSQPHPDTCKVGQRMSSFLEKINLLDIFISWNTKFIVLAPPYMDFHGDRFYESYGTANGSLSMSLKKAAEMQHAGFIDSGPWNPECCDDHIHLSAFGHRIFAENLIKEIKALII